MIWGNETDFDQSMHEFNISEFTVCFNCISVYIYIYILDLTFLNSSEIVNSPQNSSKHLLICPDSLTTLFSVSLSKNVMDKTEQGTGSAVTLVAGMPGKCVRKSYLTYSEYIVHL